MAHFPSTPSTHIVNDRFNQVHLGRAPEDDPDKKTFKSYSTVTQKYEAYHTSGEATHTLQEAIDRANENPGKMEGHQFQLSAHGRHHAELVDHLRDVGDLKIALSRKKSSEAFSLLEEKLKDFGSTGDHSASLPERLLKPNSGFESISRFIGSESEAKAFIVRILNKMFLKDFNTALDSGRWENQEQHNRERTAQELAEETVATYRGTPSGPS